MRLLHKCPWAGSPPAELYCMCFMLCYVHYVTKAEQKRLASKTTISIDNHQQQNKYEHSAHNVMSISYLYCLLGSCMFSWMKIK